MADRPTPGPGGTTWPSQHEDGPARRDARRTRQRLLAAAGDLLAADRPFTLAQVAAAADVSTATAYRHFPSADGVAHAFVAGFLDDVEARVGAADAAEVDPAAARLALLDRLWVRTVLDWGPALAHVRSPEGFLHRRARGEPEMVRSLRHVEPTLTALAAERHGGAPPADELAYLLGAWNQLADPREVLDQVATLGWSAERIAARLTAAVLAVAAAQATSSMSSAMEPTMRVGR